MPRQEVSKIKSDTSQPQSATSFVSFLSPTSKSILNTNATETIRWQCSDPDFLRKFPDFDIFFTIYDSDGNSGGVITIARTNTTSYVWKVDDMVSKFPSFYAPGKKFRIKAFVRYSGSAPFTCENAPGQICEPVYDEPLRSQMIEAKKYQSLSELFSIEHSR